MIESSYSADPGGGGWKLWTRLMAMLSSRMPVVVKRAPQLAKAAWRKRRYLGRNNTEVTLYVSHHNTTTPQSTKTDNTKTNVVSLCRNVFQPRRQELIPCTAKHPSHQNSFFHLRHFVALPQLPMVLPGLHRCIGIGHRFHPLLELCICQLLQHLTYAPRINGLPELRLIFRTIGKSPHQCPGEAEHTRKSDSQENCLAEAVLADHQDASPGGKARKLL